MSQKSDNTQQPQDDKELLYKALGVMLLIKDKFSDEFNEIFQKANASKEDILNTVDEVKNKAEEEKSEIEDKFKEKIKAVINEMGLATKEDIEELKRLIKSQQTKS
jgi:polyhydroxyalkanoate synthesis regulator phasin